MSTATPTLLQDFDVGLAGADRYYPAVGLDGRGNLFVAFTESSATTYPSAATAAQMTTDPVGTMGSVQIVARGLGTYNCGGACGGWPMRWGDYSAAATHPVDLSSVWVAAEFAASSQNGDDWRTGISRVDGAGALAATPTPSGGNSSPPGNPPPGGTPVPGTLTPRVFAPAI